MNGWIKIDRKLIDWEWFNEPETLQLWLYLLLMANFEEKKWNGITIKRGQFVTSVDKLKTVLHSTPKKIRTRLGRLKTANCIAIETTSKNTVVTILNYDLYQDQQTVEGKEKDKQEDKPRANKGQTKGNNVRTKETKNNNNINNAREEKISFAEFVTMTNDEHDKLIATYGETATKRMIEILDNYKGQSGKKYNSDYRAMLNWVVKRYQEDNQKKEKPKYYEPPSIGEI